MKRPSSRIPAPLILGLATAVLFGSTVAQAQAQVSVPDFSIDESTGESTPARQTTAPVTAGPVTIVTDGPIIIDGPGLHPQERGYHSLLARCSSIVDQLKRLKTRADMEAISGNFPGAAVLLKRGLRDVLEEMRSELTRPFPHSYKAVKASLYLSDVINAAASEQLEPELADKVGYLTLSKLYDAVFYAYYELDQKFYIASVRTCFGRGFDCGNLDTIDSGFFSDDYLRGEAKLASRFMQIYSTVAVRLADDVVELKTALATTQVAQALLETSLLRRSFCPVISDLVFVRETIRDWLPVSSAFRLGERTEVVRNWMSILQTRIDRVTRSNECRGGLGLNLN